jgi:hypothetical protein
MFEMLGQRFDRAGFRQPRQTFQEQVTVGQQTEQDLPDDLILAEHRFGNARLQGVEVSQCSHGAVLCG